jgi:hypothetical protein
MNIQLLKAADLNQMLHERGIQKNVTVQKICTRARNESEAREVLGRIWIEPVKAEELLVQLLDRNRLYWCEHQKTSLPRSSSMGHGAMI